MGGRVAVGFRFSDNTVEVHNQWTNSMLSWLTDVRIFKEDRDYIKRFQQASEGQILCAPVEYGLVLIDYVTNNLFTMQSYCDVGFRLPTTIRVHLGVGFGGPNAEELASYAILLKEGRISEVSGHNSSLLNMTVEEFIAHATAMTSTDERYNTRFAIDFSPLKIVDFEDMQITGKKGFLKALLDINFPLSAEDIRAWG